MPIARVRIAPAERWCHEYGDTPDFHVLAGIEVNIDTSSMEEEQQWKGCQSKYWAVTADSAAEISKILKVPNLSPLKLVLCEHMLELD